MVADPELINLIGQASAIAGNDARLAEHLGVPSSSIAGWKHGARSCPAEYRTVMLAMTGIPIEQAAWKAMQAANAHKKLGATLQRAAGKIVKHTATLGVLVMLCFGGAGNVPLAWPHGLRRRV